MPARVTILAALSPARRAELEAILVALADDGYYVTVSPDGGPGEAPSGLGYRVTVDAPGYRAAARLHPDVSSAEWEDALAPLRRRKGDERSGKVRKATPGRSASVDRLVVELGATVLTLAASDGEEPKPDWRPEVRQAVSSADYLISRLAGDQDLVDLNTVSRAWAYIASAQDMIASAREARAHARMEVADAKRVAAAARAQAVRSRARAERFSRWHKRSRSSR